MRKCITTIVLSIITISVFAQWETYPKAGDYIQDPALNKFVGKWQGVRNDTTFTVIFKIRKKIAAKAGYHYDAIIGWHEVKVNGIIIESSLNRVGDLSLGSRTCGVGICSKDDFTTNFRFKDITRNKSDQASFIIDSSNVNKAAWFIRNTDTISKAMANIGPDGIGRYDTSWTVPTDLIMYKIE
ncbi:DUF6705 family protein [Carboxylicivirga sp. N1Y90]|uniref:DUF6705 family protein n=1 Tax=Carboxylicivirga fragile TaxID=3417571 RepID=UPI003D33E547|nr:hypothetical protein [Marinilabiliaceae bacterium N1Y90]